MPSWLGTAGAVLVCLVWFSCCTIFVTPKRFAAAPGRFADNPQDEFPFVKARAMRVASDPAAADTYRVILIGDSAIGEAITSPKDLQRRIQRQVRQHVLVTPLIAGGLDQLEAVDLCAMVRDHMRGQVILQISPYNMALIHTHEMYDKALTGTGFETQEMSDEFAIAGMHRPVYFHNFFLRNHQFMLARISAFMRLLKPLHDPTMLLHSEKRDSSEARFQRDAKNTYLVTKGLHTKSIPNVAMYERIITPLKARGIEVALLESPLDPRMVKLDGVGNRGITTTDRKAYHQVCEKLVADTGSSLWDLARKVKFSSKDFLDYIHIGKQPARIRYTKALANRIAASIPGHRSKAATTGAATAERRQRRWHREGGMKTAANHRCVMPGGGAGHVALHRHRKADHFFGRGIRL